MSKLHLSIATAIEQIEKCDFECEAGPLANNVGWQWLIAAAKVGPEFMPGQGVWFEIEAEAAGKKLTQWVHFFVVGCAMSSGSDRRFWTYSLSWDPPAPYHCGAVHFTGVSADRLRLENPASLVVPA